MRLLALAFAAAVAWVVWRHRPAPREWDHPFGGWPFDQGEREANERRDRRRAEAERRGHW